jgi:O-antigen/teichoic acid export membrane protein
MVRAAMSLALTSFAGGEGSLAQRVFRAGGWSLMGFGTSQALRFGGNLILTRLLFPEAFGLMAIVQAVLFGIIMLSDVGIEQSVIRHRDGETPAFLNTAWTLKIIRGVLMWLITCILAAPLASFYGEPLLAQMLPVVGLTAVISGFASTKLSLADRKLSIGRKTMIEVGSVAIGLIITVIGAWLVPSVWSLVVGSLAGAVVRTIASHVALDGIANRLALDKASLSELVTFGRWILISSALTFLLGEGTRLLVAKMLDVRMLAFLSLAMAINQIPVQFFKQIGGKILYSAYSEVHRDRPERLYDVLLKSRLAQIVPYWSICVVLALFGAELMELLYDERYQDSGWMLQYLAIGSMLQCLTISYGGVLWATGQVRASTFMLAVHLILQLIAMVVGQYYWGARGLVAGLALTSWALYPAYAIVYAQLGLWQPKIDIPVIGLSVLVVALTFGRYFT